MEIDPAPMNLADAVQEVKDANDALTLAVDRLEAAMANLEARVQIEKAKLN